MDVDKDADKTKSLSEKIAASLLKENGQNGEDLTATIQRIASCSRAEAQEIIYAAAAEVNAILFPPLKQLELVLTEGCNLGCTYCFEKNMTGCRPMSLDVARRAVDFLLLYSRNETELEIAHFGGEPTLSFKTIQATTEYAKSRSEVMGKRVTFNMTTNGILLDQSMARYCAEHDIRVLLSVDGLQPAHDRYRRDKHGNGTFVRVMGSMRILKRFQPWIGIKMTVMPDNVESLLCDVQALHSMGVNQFTIGHATGAHWPDERVQAHAEAMAQLAAWYAETRGDELRIDEFEETDPKGPYFGCHAGRSSVAVSVDGQISPCSKLLALDNTNLLCKLGDVWCGLTHVTHRADIVTCAKLKAACERKGLSADYQGGCFVSNHEDTGSLFDPSEKEHRFSMLLRSAREGVDAKRQPQG